MPFWQPNQFYRFSVGLNMSGWDVWAVQVALNNNNVRPSGIPEDGVFGSATQGAVKHLQQYFGIIVDGVAGPQTQSTLCIAQCRFAENGYAPANLLKGIMLGESGGIIPTTTAPYPDTSRDYGPFQDNKKLPSQTDLHVAFSLNNQSHKLALGVASAHKVYKGQPGAETDEEAWKLAVLNYNWPAAAQQIAAGHADNWVYTSQGKTYKLSDPAPWVINIGVPGVQTGQQWCDFYIATKIVYVTDWSIIQ